MNQKRILALVLACVMVLSLAACGGPEPTQPTTQPTTAPTTQPTTAPTTEPSTVPTEPDPSMFYDQAADALSAGTSFVLTVHSSKTTTINGESYVEEAEQTISYCDYGTESFRAAVTETVDLDNYITTYDEYFQDGVLYTVVDSQYRFKGEMTAEDYTSRFAPVVMLDASLYAQRSGEGSVVHFSDPTAGESWIVPEYAELVDASGTATLTDEHTISGYTYDVTYRIGGIEISYEFEMDISTESSEALAPVEDADAYTTLEYVDAPRLIEQASGYLLQAYVGHSVTTSTTESTTSYAGGGVLNRSTTIDSYGSGDDYMANMDYSVFQMTSYGEYSAEQTEHFENGVYTYSADGGTPQKDLTVKAVHFQNYCADVLVANIPYIDLLTGATAEDLGSLYYLELTFDEAMGDSYCQYICEMLWEDPEFLNDLATEYVTNSMTIYLAIDKFTGLPTATGSYYEGNHTIEGNDYLLSMQTDQSFDLASDSAYETITEEAPVPVEPEEKATPLFYHVTGADGQEMWLLGTIHVGDERTSYLPQEIYDAFDASDALAVEFNSEAFDDALENDEELSAQVSACYFYGDGTGTADHVEDEELFDYAEKLMKATGSYHMNAPHLKAYFWSNSIENYILRQGRSLSSTQGVDNQLIWRAEDQEKPIYDVESGLFQTQMVSGFSDGLQELLLLESVASDPLEYISGTQELFEMWCAGDEAALIAYLNDEDEDDESELTDEERTLIEEYNNAMGTDRNDDMHDVAVGYLESGEVVFYAVGLAHLLAEDGLVNTLRAAGYTVELVPYE